jgi:hypothetical protein
LFFWQKNLQHKVTKKKNKEHKEKLKYMVFIFVGFVLSIFFAASLRYVLQFLPGNRLV